MDGSCRDQEETPNASSTDTGKYSTEHKCIQCESYHKSAKKLAAHRTARLEEGRCPDLTEEEKAAQPLINPATKSVLPQQSSGARDAAVSAEETLQPSTAPSTKTLPQQDLSEAPNDTIEVEKTPSKRACLYPHCGASFKSGMDRDVHIRQEHAPKNVSADKPSRPAVFGLCPEGGGCPLDLSKVDKIKFHNHLELSHHWCIPCSARFSSVGQLRGHLRQHSRPTGPRVPCADSGCPSTFRNHGQMMVHYWDSEVGHAKVAPSGLSDLEAQFKCPIGHPYRLFHTQEEAIKHFELIHRPTSGNYAEHFDDEDLSIMEESLDWSLANAQLPTGNHTPRQPSNGSKHDISDGSDSDQPLLKKYRRSRGAPSSIARSDDVATDAMDTTTDVSTRNEETGSDETWDEGPRDPTWVDRLFIGSDEDLMPVREPTRKNQRRRPTTDKFTSETDNTTITTAPNESTNGQKASNPIPGPPAASPIGLARSRSRRKIILSDAGLRAQRKETLETGLFEKTGCHGSNLESSKQKDEEVCDTSHDARDAPTPMQIDDSAGCTSSPAALDKTSDAMDWSPTDSLTPASSVSHGFLDQDTPPRDGEDVHASTRVEDSDSHSSSARSGYTQVSGWTPINGPNAHSFESTDAALTMNIDLTRARQAAPPGRERPQHHVRSAQDQSNTTTSASSQRLRPVARLQAETYTPTTSSMSIADHSEADSTPKTPPPETRPPPLRSSLRTSSIGDAAGIARDTARFSITGGSPSVRFKLPDDTSSIGSTTDRFAGLAAASPLAGYDREPTEDETQRMERAMMGDLALYTRGRTRDKTHGRSHGASEGAKLDQKPFRGTGEATAVATSRENEPPAEVLNGTPSVPDARSSSNMESLQASQEAGRAAESAVRNERGTRQSLTINHALIAERVQSLKNGRNAGHGPSSARTTEDDTKADAMIPSDDLNDTTLVEDDESDSDTEPLRPKKPNRRGQRGGVKARKLRFKIGALTAAPAAPATSAAPAPAPPTIKPDPDSNPSSTQPSTIIPNNQLSGMMLFPSGIPGVPGVAVAPGRSQDGNGQQGKKKRRRRKRNPSHTRSTALGNGAATTGPDAEIKAENEDAGRAASRAKQEQNGETKLETRTQDGRKIKKEKEIIEISSDEEEQPQKEIIEISSDDDEVPHTLAQGLQGQNGELRSTRRRDWDLEDDERLNMNEERQRFLMRNRRFGPV